MKPFSGLKLGGKITAVALVGLVVGIGVFSFLGMKAVNRTSQAIIDGLSTTARVVSGYLDETLNRAIAELELAAARVDVTKPAGIESTVSSLEDTYQRLSIYLQNIYVLDDVGQIIWSKPGASDFKGGEMLSLNYISDALASGKPAISGLVSAPPDQTPVVFLISPLGDGFPAKGLLVASVDVARSSIGGLVQPIRVGATGYAEIIEQNGMVIARTQPGPALSPFEKSDHSGRFADLIMAGKPAGGLCHTCHEPVPRVATRDVLAFVPLSAAKWGVVIRQAESEALAPITDLRRSLFIFGAVLAATVILFAILFTRDVLGRIRMLTRAAQRMAQGDLASPVAITSGDELGTLARSFEDMRQKLDHSYGESERMTTELSSLLSVSEILTSLRDLSDLAGALGSALDKTLEVMKADSGGILLSDREGERLRYRAHRGLLVGYASRVRPRVGKGLFGEVAQTGQMAAVADVAADPRTEPDRLAAEGLVSLVALPLSSKDRVLGVLWVGNRQARHYSEGDLRLLGGVARQITTAVENARLHREVQFKEEIRGELLKDIITIQEEERRRIARELHDETSQDIVSLNANLEAATGMLPETADKVKEILRKAQSLGVGILDEIHKLIYELRPSLLDDLGLVAAARWLADNNLAAAGIKVHFKVTGKTTRLPSSLEIALFRVIQEAVSNIARHSRAKNAAIGLIFRKKVVKIKISDDGLGFDLAEAVSSKQRPRGLGLLGMRERVEQANGTIEIHSHPGGGGTEVEIEIPLSEEAQVEQNKNNDG